MGVFGGSPGLSDEGGLVFGAGLFCVVVVDDEVDAGDVEGFAFDEVFGAVAEFGHLEMGVAGEFEPGSDEYGVDFDAGCAGKLEVKLGGLVSLGGAGEDPSAAGEQGSGEKADETRGFVGAEGSEVQAPALAVQV